MKPEQQNREDWLQVSRDVIAGKYRTADRSTIESIIIGLQNLAGTEQALLILDGLLDGVKK